MFEGLDKGILVCFIFFLYIYIYIVWRMIYGCPLQENYIESEN